MYTILQSMMTLVCVCVCMCVEPILFCQGGERGIISSFSFSSLSYLFLVYDFYVWASQCEHVFFCFNFWLKYLCVCVCVFVCLCNPFFHSRFEPNNRNGNFRKFCMDMFIKISCFRLLFLKMCGGATNDRIFPCTFFCFVLFFFRVI